MFEHYLNIFITTVFIENIALSVFLGMCTFIAISKKIDAAIGLGIAVIVVCLITVPLNNLIYNFILRDGALAWAGLPDTNLEFVELISYIGVIAAVVQILEMFLDKYVPTLYNALGVAPLLSPRARRPGRCAPGPRGTAASPTGPSPRPPPSRARSRRGRSAP